jgi:predicted RND superfamily exporter protein
MGATALFTSGNDKQLLTYINNSKGDAKMMQGFIDTTGQVARITVEIPDIGSHDMPLLLAKLQKKFDLIFDPAQYKVTFTGTSVIAVEGYRYLIDNLISSVLLSFILNALIIGWEFRSWRMLLLSLIPNIVPLLFTAGLMGYFQINLKPSTVLIFSIAFGMSVDFSIHLLARFKQNFQKHNWNISKTVAVAIREAGVSMIYNCIIIFFGFGVFMLSDFNGTVYLGMLVSITLFVSMLANLIILPALILSFGEKLFPKLPAVNGNNIHAEEEIEVGNIN